MYLRCRLVIQARMQSRELGGKPELRERPAVKMYKFGGQSHADWRADEIMEGVSDFKESTAEETHYWATKMSHPRP